MIGKLKSHQYVNPAFRSLGTRDFFETNGKCRETLMGRGKVGLFSICDNHFVRKRYRRGGWVRKFIHDQYAFTGLVRKRMFREFHLLGQLRQHDLPVPEPVAFRCDRPTLFTYAGDLVTVLVADSETLGTRLKRHVLPPEVWGQIGTVLGRFHRLGVVHADLNVENIMIGSDFSITLLDFDKGRILKGHHARHTRNNLNRLHRSLRKGVSRFANFHFDKNDWQTMIASHRKAIWES